MIQVLHLTLLLLKILNEFNPAGLFEFITKHKSFDTTFIFAYLLNIKKNIMIIE